MSDKIPISTGLERLAEIERTKVEEHPTLDELFAYHEGTLSAEDSERVQDYLTLHPEAVRNLLDFASEAASPPAKALPAGLKESILEGIESQAENSRGSPASSLGERGKRAVSEMRFRTYFRLAAGIAAITSSALVWNLMTSPTQTPVATTSPTQTPVATTSPTQTPLATVGTLVLQNEGRRTRGSSEIPEAEAGPLNVKLIHDRVSVQSLSVELVGSDGRIVWQGDVHEIRTQSGSREISVVFPDGFLEPDNYVFRLYEDASGSRELQETFRMRIIPSP